MKLVAKVCTIFTITAFAIPCTAAAMSFAANWEIGPIVRGKNYSVGMPAHPRLNENGHLVMDFPLAGHGQVDALTTRVAPLTGARQITLRYRIDASRGARFIPDETPSEPATISLYFQQAGDNWSARGRYATYRWYAPANAVFPLTPGEHTMTVRFDEKWTNVNGQPNNLIPAGYVSALENTARIGLAFGSPSRRSHGVFSTGLARFTLLSFQIN